MLCIRLLCIKPIDETRVDANYLCKFSKRKKNMYNIQYYQDHAVWYGILCDLNANCRSAACKQISVQCAGHFLRSMVWSPTFTSSCHFLQWIQCSSDSSEYWAFEWNGNTLRVYNRFLDGRHSPPGQLNLFILWIMQKKTLQNREAGKKRPYHITSSVIYIFQTQVAYIWVVSCDQNRGAEGKGLTVYHCPPPLKKVSLHARGFILWYALRMANL